MKCKNWDVGVCNWSLRTDIDGAAAAMKEIGLQHVHLDVTEAAKDKSGDVLKKMAEQDWTISCTMVAFPQEDYTTFEAIKLTGGIVPDEHWESNRELALGAIDATAKLGVKYISTHAGFIDESDPAYAAKIKDRIKVLADAAAEKDIMLLMETGQETAEELKEFLDELKHPALGVNFDPANMILYDKGTPVEAVQVLAPWIKHLHIKDAIRTKEPGTWGEEVPWGDGEVIPEAFLKELEEVGFEGVMAIEREQGDNRLGDIKLAAERLAAYGG